MKFSIMINMDRFDSATDMQQVARERTELVRLADQAGFEIAWVAEHHTIEATIAPNPFVILTHWASKTSRIRLGTGIISAPYWTPIRLAGEAALFDLLSDGRLELGIGRGSYQYEFDRMMPGLDQRDGNKYMREIVPAVKELWKGDYAHSGEIWNFPKTTSVPKPVQKPFPRLWVAARDPDTFDWGFKNGLNIMSTPLQRPHDEVNILCARFEDTVRNNPDVERPIHMMLRRTCVYDSGQDWHVPARSLANFGRYFENLFKNIASVENGFAEPVSFDAVSNRTDYDLETLHANMMFGTPDEVVEKLKLYEAAGVDHYLYGASFGLPFTVAAKSIELFAERVMPYFALSTKPVSSSASLGSRSCSA